MAYTHLNRIAFREVEPSDFEIVFKWENNPKHWLQSGVEQPYTSEEIRTYVSKKQTLEIDGQTRRIIIDKSGNQIIGAIDLFKYSSKHHSACVGILVDDEFRRQSYATEAILRIEPTCLKEFGIKQLECQVLKQNVASQKLFEKLGYIEVAELQRAYFYLGEYYTQLTYRKIL